jgi:FlaG/FlaF family flagellin (archaellin)
LTWIKGHKLIVAGIIIIAICFGFLGVILLEMFDQKPVSSSQVVSKEESTSPLSQNTTKAEEKITDNPFGPDNSSLSAKEILVYMHGMSHQKAVAEEKWVHYEMTNERIQFLISVVESGSYENEELFLDILNRWAEGDFSKADKDHNEIWSLQGGTVGEATGVMSAKEEQQYLENYKGSIK